jgi:hypothetical protein
MLQEKADSNFETHQIMDKLKYDLSDEDFEKKIKDFINNNLLM